MRRIVRLLCAAVELQPGIATFRTRPVRPAVDLHLQEAQIEPQLNLFAAIIAGNDANRHVSGSKSQPFKMFEISRDTSVFESKANEG